MHDFKMPIGPHHPAIDEPSCLRVSMDGNYIVDADLRLGYAHKGIEKLLEGKRIEQGLHIVDHICGICSVAHPSCYVRVIEKMLNYEPIPRVNYIRTLVSELGRIQSHVFWAGFMLHEIGFETMLAYFLRDREHILESLERLTGNRVHFAIHKTRTVRNDVNDNDIRFIEKKIEKVEEQIEKKEEKIGTLGKKEKIIEKEIKKEEKKVEDLKKQEEKLKEEKEEISFDIKKIKNIFRNKNLLKYSFILLILIPLFFSVYFRVQPSYLPIMDDFALNVVLTNLKEQIADQILKESPNLPPQTLQKEVERRLQAEPRSKIITRHHRSGAFLALKVFNS